MKAVVLTRYGPPEGLQLTEVAKPEPKDNEVLIRVRATTVTAGDTETRSLRFSFPLALAIRLYVGPTKPRNFVLGQELAGEIEATGKNVSRFQVGDQVFAATGIQFGGYGEYICLPEDGAVAIKPSNMRYEEAAAVPTAGLEALHFLKAANIKPGEKVLIVGAGGSIGTFGVQLARYYGATVTGVDSAGKLDALRAIGADHVIDYAAEDFTASGETYDVIFDVIGKSAYARSLRVLHPGGRYLLANPNLSLLLRGRWTTMTDEVQVILGPASQTREDLEFIRGLIEAGHLKTIIDRRYPLEETAEAHRYVEAGTKIGHVVIAVGEQPDA